MKHISRKAAQLVNNIVKQNKSILLLGPRQTGKTTLVDRQESSRVINLIDPRLRLRYEANPGLLIDEISAIDSNTNSLPLIIIDEIQKAPELMDSVQFLIDKKIAKFILTGSSARKLKRNNNINLLPGRIIAIHLDALMLNELPKQYQKLEDLLIYGSLPEIVLTDDTTLKEQLLDSYVITYLEEEVRAEAIVRQLGNFSRFLELAAAESGYSINVSALSQNIGVSNTTIQSYYQILEDCLIIERIEPIIESKTRHRLSKAQKYLFFDLGVRRLAAKEGVRLPMKYKGHLFEQFIGIELIRMARLQTEPARIRYWKDQNGPEVDWVIQTDGQLIPIEVKWSDKPSKHDARHLQLFLNEYKSAKKAYIVCQTPHRMKIDEQVTAIPWEEMVDLFNA